MPSFEHRGASIYYEEFGHMKQFQSAHTPVRA